ncbi:hypothetical protein EV360DRAFT_58367, partial [Lentinula raphanica]
MDLKAARPWCGFLDVTSHLFCFVCCCWHKAHLCRTDFENWKPVDDEYLRKGAELWRNVKTIDERRSIEALYGTRYSEFWRLPYWKPSAMVAIEPMHTFFLILEQRFFRDALAHIDSVQVLERIQAVVRQVIMPVWSSKPPPDIGLPKAGTLKADHWRTLFTIHLPLALLSLWREESPLAAEDAAQMTSVLDTGMTLSCASIIMIKNTLTAQRRELFRNLLRRHVLGLQQNFPGFMLPTHHLAFHLYDFMELFSVVREFWNFAFEGFIGKIQRTPTNHR